jgi:hypothetical protein
MRCRTIRSLMLLIAALAVIMSAYTSAAKSRAKAKSQRYQAALKQYDLLKADYDLGRLTVEDFFPASEELMNAEYDVRFGRRAKTVAVAAHVERTAHKVELESEVVGCRGDNWTLPIAQRYNSEAQARLNSEMAK